MGVMNISSVGLQILQQLIKIENIMRSLGLLNKEAPSDEALSSDLPFCCDQMQFHEWVQHVLIPSTRYSLSMRQPPPYRSPLSVVAETEMAALSQDTNELLLAIHELDELFRQL